MTTMYVQNISPHKTLRNMTLEEAFPRVKSEVGHFGIFGCSTYIHVPKEKRTKLDRSTERVHLWGTMSLRRHTRSTSLVRDRLR